MTDETEDKTIIYDGECWHLVGENTVKILRKWLADPSAKKRLTDF